MRNKKRMMLILITMLIVGFASVSTTLVLNGLIGISSNQNDFIVIFTSAKLNNKNRNDFIDKDTKQTIDFITDKLTTKNEEAILDYEVTNTSRLYDGEVVISCIVPENDYVVVDYQPKSMTVEAGDTKSGRITAKLIKVSTEDDSISITCTLNATAVEKDELGSEYIPPFSRSGVMAPLYRTESFWEETPTSVLEYRENITKVVFENKTIAHDTSEDLIFDVSETQDGSVMAYLVPNDDILVEAKDESYYLEYNEAFTELTQPLINPVTSNKGGDQAYTLYIGSDTGVKASKYSFATFYHFINLREIEGMQYYDASDKMLGIFEFTLCENLKQIDLGYYDVTNITNFTGMFAGCISLTELDLYNFHTSNASNMMAMFAYCTNLKKLNVSSFDTSNVTDMTGMFAFLENIHELNVRNFNTSKVIDMTAMFYVCKNLKKLDLSSFDTSSTTEMNYMFDYCHSLTALNLSSFDTSNVRSISDMFGYCYSLTTLDLSSWDTSNVTNMNGLFNNCSSLITLDISGFDISKVTESWVFFYNMPTNATIKVKDATVQDWVLTREGCPSEWSTDNVIIVT